MFDADHFELTEFSTPSSGPELKCGFPLDFHFNTDFLDRLPSGPVALRLRQRERRISVRLASHQQDHLHVGDLLERLQLSLRPQSCPETNPKLQFHGLHVANVDVNGHLPVFLFVVLFGQQTRPDSLDHLRPDARRCAGILRVLGHRFPGLPFLRGADGQSAVHAVRTEAKNRVEREGQGAERERARARRESEATGKGN